MAMYYFELLKAFHENRIEYLIVGGLAVNLHGVPRVTQDIDIVIAMDEGNILKVNGVMRSLAYVPRLPVNPDDLANESVREEWMCRRNMKAFSFYHSKQNYRVVDIILLYNADYDSLKKNRVIKNAGEVEINVVGIDDLINMKSFSGREQDLSDIRLLQKVKQFMEADGRNGK